MLPLLLGVLYQVASGDTLKRALNCLLLKLVQGFARRGRRGPRLKRGYRHQGRSLRRRFLYRNREYIWGNRY